MVNPPAGGGSAGDPPTASRTEPASPEPTAAEQRDTVGEESGDHLISVHSIATFLPAGAVLIIVHTILHMVIDIDYFARGKTPPERMRSGH